MQTEKLNLFTNLRYIDINNDSSIWIINQDNLIIKIEPKESLNIPVSKLSLLSLKDNENEYYTIENLNMPAKKSYVYCKLSMPFYLKQQGVEFRYRISGLDDNWSEWSESPEIEIKYIPPGSYKLQMMAKNEMGNESEQIEIDIKISKPFTQTFGFILLIIILTLAIAYSVFKIRMKKLEHDKLILEQKVEERTYTIRKQKDKIEEQHDDITQSIRYAKRIQTAMLPHDEIMEAMLPEHFILFKPRDIVSGDFYFFKPIGDKLVFVAADCTGHGVPGGFMSMLGISFLGEITSQIKKPTASEIIDHLREKIKITLGQTDEGSTQKDGMDLSICVIDTTKKTLQFAGAYNPLYRIKNNKLEIVKADRQPVAVYFNEHEFTNHAIKVEDGETFYMFSDGYPDQMGGPKEKKFMTKNFKNLLLDINTKSMNEQKQILNDKIEEWKGELMQIDDILVVGFRI